jgi:hypothetical protein
LTRSGVIWKHRHPRRKSKSLFNQILKIVYILPVGLVFDLFHQVFRLGSLDKEVIIAFARFIYAYGPDWDEESKRIKEYVAENKLKEAVNVALSVKND